MSGEHRPWQDVKAEPLAKASSAAEADYIENLPFPEHEVLAPTGAAEEEASYWQWAMGRAEPAPREGNLRLPEFGKAEED